MASSRRSAKNAEAGGSPTEAHSHDPLFAALRAVNWPVGASPTRASALSASPASSACAASAEPAARAFPAAPVALVALSGGLDSTVLLHALGSLLGAERVQAVHVHHGLQAAADAWPAFCQTLCDALGVRLTVLRLGPRPAAGVGIETWARRERYRVIGQLALELGCERIVTAHHADDQAETVLLRLARGTGLGGLSAMAPVRPMGDLSAGTRQVSKAGESSKTPAGSTAELKLLRPLLSVPRSALQAYAQAHQLNWVEDPSNAALDTARNRLRAQVLPELERVAPGARDNLLRAAGLAREAQLVLDEVTAQDLARAQRVSARLARLRGHLPQGLALARLPVAPLHRQALAALSPPRLALLLLAWCGQGGAGELTSARLAELRKQLIDAQGGYGELHLGGKVLRRYRDWLWIEDEVPMPVLPAEPVEGRWSGETSLALGDGRVLIEPGAMQGLSSLALAQSTISLRALPSSTRVRLRAEGPSRSLKHWHQQFGVPAPLRASLPGVFVGDRLVFVAGLGSHHEPAQAGMPSAVSDSVSLRWEPATVADPRWWVCAAQQSRENRV